MLRICTRRLIVALAVLVVPGLPGDPSLLRAQPATTTLFRIFLSDPREATSLVSYGEYARLDDQVVFSLPIDIRGGSPRLHLVSIPATDVDWPATERYAQSARYATYLAARAEADFGAMSTEVAEALNRIALTDRPDARLQMAEAARQTLVVWPERHFGYRSSDIRGYVGLLDEIISELRVATGSGRFDLSLMATVEPPTTTLLPRPGPMEFLEQALVAARLSRTPAERTSLLQSIVSALDGDSLVAEGAANLRARATTLLGEEQRVDQAYARVVRVTTSRAEAFASDADVRGVEGVLTSIDGEDERLGRARPAIMTSLHLTVERTLDEARELRLARDQWRSRRKAYQRYEQATREHVRRLAEVEPLLDDIKVLAGPDLTALDDLERRLARIARRLDGVEAPAGMQAVHGLLTTALQYAQSAAQKRRQAVVEGDIRTAWDASSAAAASVMLRIQAQERLQRLLDMPQRR